MQILEKGGSDASFYGYTIGLYQPLDGFTNPKCKLLDFLTTNFFFKREGTNF